MGCECNEKAKTNLKNQFQTEINGSIEQESKNINQKKTNNKNNQQLHMVYLRKH